MRISRKKRPQKLLIPRYRLNEFIKVPEVMVLDEEGNNLGVMAIGEALAKAREEELDLVEINPKVNPPVCKLTDFTRFKYQKEKEAKKQKIRAHETETKGIRLSIRISEHDLDVRLAQAEKFLERGDKIKTEIILRGRENIKPAIGFGVTEKFKSKLSEKMELRTEQKPTKQANKITAIFAKK